MSATRPTRPADTSAELGHLLEVCQLQRDDLDFFSSLTADSA
jgi:hypothetical protein